MSSHADEKLVHMANQIARNLTLDYNPAAAMAEHIRAFWNPPLIDGLLRESNAALDPIAAEALALLDPARG